MYRKGTSPQGNNMMLEDDIRKAKELTDKVMIFGALISQKSIGQII